MAVTHPRTALATEKLTTTLIAQLQEIPGLVPLTRIDRAWVFPPRVVGEVESGLVVLSLRSEEEPDSDQREVVTVRYEVRTGKGKSAPTREVASRGRAPSARVPLVMAGVVRRLGGVEDEPRTGAIDGDAERWNRLVTEVSEEMVDPANGE